MKKKKLSHKIIFVYLVYVKLISFIHNILLHETRPKVWYKDILIRRRVWPSHTKTLFLPKYLPVQYKADDNTDLHDESGDVAEVWPTRRQVADLR